MGGLSILKDQYEKSGYNLILKSDLDDFKQEYNKPNTIFLAHVRRMHWVCFSNIYMSDSRYKNNGFYVIYDCLNKDCPTRDTWLAAFDLYIKKLCPGLEKRNLINVSLKGKMQANPNLLAFSYVVSLLEGENPAEFEYQENHIMIEHFNNCIKSRFFNTFPFSKRFSIQNVKYLEHRFKDNV
jgi:hypothetical protein